MFRLPNFLNPFKVRGNPSPSVVPSPPASTPPSSTSLTENENASNDPTEVMTNTSNNQRKNAMLTAAYGNNSNKNARLRPMYNKFRNNLAQKTSTTRNAINLTFNKYKNLRNTRGLKTFWNKAEAAKGDEIYGQVYGGNNGNIGNGAYSQSNRAKIEERLAELVPQTLRVSGGRRTSKRSTKRRRNGKRSSARR